MSDTFKSPLMGESQDRANELRPKFGADGLVAAVAQDAGTGEILMLAWMNEKALRQTMETGQATYYSRSRRALWRKGETSGHTQTVREMLVDCDQDAVVLKVDQTGAACHTGRKSCFYRQIEADGTLSFLPAEE
jgi:phosphoribosyl-AMP cyclohydrolase